VASHSQREEHDGADRHRPHKATHTAVAVDNEETALAELTVKQTVTRSSASQMGDRLSGSTMAIESANGLGFLSAQQLVAAGEDVVDVHPRWRLGPSSGSGKTRRMTPTTPCPPPRCLAGEETATVLAEDHSAVLRLLADTIATWVATHPAVCRLHALVELIPGGTGLRLSQTGRGGDAHRGPTMRRTSSASA